MRRELSAPDEWKSPFIGKSGHILLDPSEAKHTVQWEVAYDEWGDPRSFSETDFAKNYDPRRAAHSRRD